MSNDWMIWAIMLQQQAQQAEAARQRAEQQAQQKAADDAAKAQQAEQQRQAQIAQQRQKDVAAAQASEQQRTAAQAQLPGALAPSEAWSPLSGTGYGQTVAKSGARNYVDSNTAPQSGNAPNTDMFSGFKQSPQQQVSPLGSMFGQAAQPAQNNNQQQQPKQQASGGGAGSFRMF